jgi:hypothetical protein
MAKYLEACSYILQHLGHVLAKLAKSAAAVRASFMARHMGVDFAWQMLRQRSAEGPRRRWSLGGSSGLRLFDRVGRLQFFELQLKLIDLTEDLFALSPEEHPLQLLDKQRQALDLARARVESRLVSLP